jgi:hypothetical protein
MSFHYISSSNGKTQSWCQVIQKELKRHRLSEKSIVSSFELPQGCGPR